jgi:RHS repeat-associated protein
MRRRPAFISVAGAVALALAISGVNAAPEPAQAATAAEPKIVTPPDTELNKTWAPPTAAAGKSAVLSVGPDEEWALPESQTPRSRDGSANRAPAGTIAAAPGLGALPYFSFDQVDLSTDTVARVNLGNGNLLLTSADGVLNGPSLSVRNDRFYNGLSTSNGSHGGGWSSPLSAFDFGLQTNSSTSVTFRGPNGISATFTKPGAVWIAPPGFNATLVGTTTKTLTYNQSGEQLVFNASGWVTQNLDRNGVGTTYTYNASTGRTATVTEASGRTYTIAWTTIGPSSFAAITSITDGAGRATTYTHNTTGQLTRVDSPGGYWEEYDYDASGRIFQMRAVGTGAAASNARIDFEYDSQSRVTAIKRGAPTGAYLTTQSYGYSAGQTTVTDGRGKVSTHKIDTSGRVTSAIDALGRTRAKTWTANSDVATTTDASGSGSTPGQTTTYAYDSLNNAVGTTLPTGAAASAAYATGVGCAGAGGTPFQPKCSSDDAGNGKSFDYDANGNLTKVSDSTAGGSGAVPQQFTYASVGYACPAGGGIPGQTCSSKDGNGNVTSYKYDASGNLAKIVPPAPMGATTYTHDALGRVLTVTNGKGEMTIFAYNVRDEIVSTTFAGSATVATTYYANGVKSGDNEATGTTGPLKFNYYDVLNRLTQQVSKAGSRTVNYNFTYDAAHNTLSQADSDYGTTSYVYDDANQMTQMIQPGGACPAAAGSPSGSGCIKFTYDRNGAEATRTLPGNAVIVTAKDAASRTTRITAKNAAGTAVADVGYSFTAAGGTGPTADRTSIQARTSFAATGIPAGAVTAYGYDSLSRLTSAVEKVGATVNASWTYGYDPAGNRTQQVRAGNTGAPAGTTIYAYNSANQLASTNADTTAWTYDAAGGQTKNGITGQTAAYNSRGAVASIGASSYTAFGQGNADTLTRSSGPTTYRTSPIGFASETSGTTQRVYDRTPGGEAVGMNHTFYFVTDHQNSVVGVFDGTGTWYGGYSYSPYGETRAVGANPVLATIGLRYISGYLDSSAGLYKFGARYYDATTGRFTQTDPTGQEPNPFAYAEGNPISNIDPTGTATVRIIVDLVDAFRNGQDIASVISNYSSADLAGILVGGALEAGCLALTGAASGGIALAVAYPFCAGFSEIIGAAVTAAAS